MKKSGSHSFIKHILDKKYVPTSYKLLLYSSLAFVLIISAVCLYIIITKILLSRNITVLHPFSAFEMDIFSSMISTFIFGINGKFAAQRNSVADAIKFNWWSESFKNDTIHTIQKVMVSRQASRYLAIEYLSESEFRVPIKADHVPDFRYDGNLYDAEIKLYDYIQYFIAGLTDKTDEIQFLISELSKYYALFKDQDILESYLKDIVSAVYIIIFTLLAAAIVFVVFIIITYIKVCQYIDSIYMLLSLCNIPHIEHSINLLFKNNDTDRNQLKSISADLKKKRLFSRDYNVNQYIRTTNRFNKSLIAALLVFFSLVLLFLIISILFFKDVKYFSTINRFKSSVAKYHLSSNLTFFKLLFPNIDIQTGTEHHTLLLKDIYADVYVKNSYSDVIDEATLAQTKAFCDWNASAEFFNCDKVENGINNQGHLEGLNYVTTEQLRLIATAKNGQMIPEPDIIKAYMVFGYLYGLNKHIVTVDEKNLFDMVQKNNKSNIYLIIWFVIISIIGTAVAVTLTFSHLKKRTELCMKVFQLIPNDLFFTNSKLKTFINRLNGNN